jgi:hypothetical protein
MRKFLITAAALASTIAVAAPAAAQWQQPNGYAYGYNNRGQARRLEVRVMQLRREIAQLDRRNLLSNREARRLDAEARNLEYRVRQLSYNGIDPRERFYIERQISRLEQQIRREASDGDRRFGDRRYDNDRYGNDGRYGGNVYDRDRDGRDDRYEDDRGREHDRHDDRDD